MSRALLALTVCMLLASCTPAAQASPPTPTMANTPTVTPTAPASATPEPTATKRISQYSLTTIENYISGAPVPEHDLFNGDYFDFIQTLSQPFDEAKIINQVSCMTMDDGDIRYGGYNDDDLSDPNTSPVKRGIVVNYTVVENVVLGPNKLGSRPWIILPVEFFNPQNPTKPIWVTFAQGKSANLNDNQWLEIFLKPWLNSFTLHVGATYKYTSSPDSQDDPIIKRSFDLYPDLPQRLRKFGETCDPSYISAPGLFLPTGPVTKK